MESPIFFSLLIIISAYIPLFTLERVERRLFTPMAFTVCYALLGSMLLALTLIPVLATYLFRNGARPGTIRVLRWLYNVRAKCWRTRCARPGLVVAGAGAVVLGAFALGALLGSEFLPQLDEGAIWVRANFPRASRWTNRPTIASQDPRTSWRQFPEVKLVSSQTGRNDAGTDPYGPNRNEFFVALKPYDTWPNGMDKPKLVDQISDKLRAEIPGAAFSFTQPIIDNVTEAVTGSPADLAVIISGPDLEAAAPAGRPDAATAAQGSGRGGHRDRAGIGAGAAAHSDRSASVARYGINVRDVQDVIEMAIGGKPVSTVFEGEKRFDMTVRYRPEARTRHHMRSATSWCPRTMAAASAALAAGADSGGERRQHHRAPREPPPDLRAHQHSRARSGKLRARRRRRIQARA